VKKTCGLAVLGDQATVVAQPIADIVGAGVDIDTGMYTGTRFHGDGFTVGEQIDHLRSKSNVS
jgi:hypothetical protein